MSGAQLCSIEDVRITGTRFTAGIVGLPGSGGYSTNIRVTGGQFAIWEAEYRPNPSITGLVAMNQSVAAILLENSRGPLIISGFVVRTFLASVVAGIKATGARGGDGSLALEDGVIIMGGEASTVAAVSTAGPDVVLKDVWVQSPAAVEFVGGTLRSTAGVTKHAPSWWFSAPSPRSHGGGAPSSTSIAYSNGLNMSAQATTGFPTLNLPAAPASPAPDDATLSLKHSWTRNVAQSLAWCAESSVMLDAVRDCGATPSWVNDTDDDGAAISTCLQRSSTVFVPRGVYLLWSPLTLRSGQNLIGAGKHCSALMMRPGAIFATDPLVQIVPADGAVTARAALSDLVLVTAQRGTILSTSTNTLIRDLRTTPCPPHYSAGVLLCARSPADAAGSASVGGGQGAGPRVAGVRFIGGAYGRLFGLSLDHFSKYLVAGDALLSASGAMAASGIHLYQLSAEHLPTDYQIQLQSTSGVYLHAFKFESAGFLAHPSWGPPGGGLFSCHASSNVSIFGGSGNCGIMNATLASNIIFAADCPMQMSAMVRKPPDGEVPAAAGALWIRWTRSDSGETIEIDDSNPSVLAFS